MAFRAKTTVPATGGAGRIFAASTNAFINTGDGPVWQRAGIPPQDMEFWQFSPNRRCRCGRIIDRRLSW